MIILNSKPLSTKKANEWGLVLEAMDIPFVIESNERRWNILVEEEIKAKALEQISFYESENYAQKHQNLNINQDEKTHYAILVPFFLYLFFILVSLTDDTFHWINKGSASAQAILDGEWWRAVTALTLHADIAHLFSNLLFGAITATLLLRQIGSGLAWLLILGSGFLGDVFNSLLFQKNHYSIGASTAVFGIIGILSSLQFNKTYRLKRWKAWVPFASGLSMLAFFGTEGKNTDITAHFFGFFSGLGIGFGTGFFLKGKILKMGIQFTLGLISLLIVIFSWILALRS